MCGGGQTRGKREVGLGQVGVGLGGVELKVGLGGWTGGSN